MSQQLTVMNSSRSVSLTEDDLTILKNTKFKGFDDAEIAYCSRISGHLALNPLLNQIHFVKRRNKDGTYAISSQVGIDGLRLGAQRTGEYAGSDEAVFEYDDVAQRKPAKATVTVYRIVSGMRCAFTASARWNEYYSPIGGQWDRMPHVMLGKVSEAQALRKAFPAELSVLRSDEEMEQADRPDKAKALQVQVTAQSEPVVEERFNETTKIGSLTESNNVPLDALKCSLCGSTNVMLSKYNANQGYCRACKKAFDVAAAEPGTQG